MTALRTSLFAAVFALAACGPADATIDTQNEDVVDGASADLAAASAGRFESFVGKDGQHYFHLLAANGEKVLGSEGYASAQGAQGGIASVKANGANAARYLSREASDGSRYFVLTAANGAIIGMSQFYATQASADRGQAAVQRVVGNIVGNEAAAAGATRFETFKGLDGRYYFHLKANNGEIVLQSQSYAAKASATAGIASVKANGVLAARYEVRAAADGKSYFVLKAGNGAIIGRSEAYASASNAVRGIATVQALLGDTK
jgi:uncharacterized protein YegP (UPF0339 family)